VHNFDNAFAGTATWLNALGSANKFTEREWYQVQECSIEPPGALGYGFRLARTTVSALFSAACSFSGETEGICDPAVNPNTLAPLYGDYDTTCNSRGLTPEGENLIDMMMDKGMLIDIDHMSNKSLNETLDRADNRDYPLVASHGLFFDLHEEIYGDLGVQGSGLGQKGRHERLRTRQQLDRMDDNNSLIAIMTMDDVQIDKDLVGQKFTKPYTPVYQAFGGLQMPFISDDCRHSTVSFAQAYSYAVDKMEGPVTLGTDFNGVAAHIGPRFGPDACGGRGLARETHQERVRQDQAGNRLQYPFTSEFGTFDKQVTGLQTYDFNVDGLAHIGLLPDMLADLKQIGFSDAQLEPLLTSANGYIEVWEQARNDPTCVVPEPGVIPGLLMGMLAMVGLANRRKGQASV
jgi:microsomal dipeptidase-like Zn-dependent dipeptidase